MTWDTTPSGHMLGFKETGILSTVLFDGYEIKENLIVNR